MLFKAVPLVGCDGGKKIEGQSAFKVLDNKKTWQLQAN